jgi:predicted secreted protein
MAAEFGYNIAFKVNNKTFAGRTQDNLTITPTIKESITKDDAGAKNNSVTGHEVTFSCQGLVVVSETGATTKLMRDDIVELALAKGDSAKVPFSYQAGSGSTPLTGNAVITNYSEDSNSEDEATYTVDLRSTGEVTFGNS